MFLCRRIEGQSQIGVDLAQEKPRPGIAAEQQRMLAAPADAGSRREFHFHHRCGIGEHAVAERTDRLLDALAQRLETITHQLVVVAPARVFGDIGARAVSQRNLFIFKGSCVVHAAGNYAQRPGLELGRPRAERRMAGHILHFAMPALPQPFEQPRLRRRQVGIADANRLEPQFESPGLDARRERGVVHACRY